MSLINHQAWWFLSEFKWLVKSFSFNVYKSKTLNEKGLKLNGWIRKPQPKAEVLSIHSKLMGKVA
ncbi:hypothetical protein AVO42_04115 [Thiomicrospira sp. XS5]|nr:hypothetical protein AVO42_04115 [Thiomicrospira sp. XS5]